MSETTKTTDQDSDLESPDEASKTAEIASETANEPTKEAADEADKANEANEVTDDEAGEAKEATDDEANEATDDEAGEAKEATDDETGDDKSAESSEEKADPIAFGMQMKWADNLFSWFESQQREIQKALGPSNSVTLGLAGILLTSWLAYTFVIKPMPEIPYGVKLMHRVKRPTKSSALMTRAYYSFSSNYWAKRSLSQSQNAKLPSPQAKLLRKLMKQVDQNHPSLSRKMRRSLNIGTAMGHLRNYLKEDKPRARSYGSYFLSNILRARALHLDLMILLVRSLLIGFLLIVSIRLFFDDIDSYVGQAS